MNRHCDSMLKLLYHCTGFMPFHLTCKISLLQFSYLIATWLSTSTGSSQSRLFFCRSIAAGRQLAEVHHLSLAIFCRITFEQVCPSSETNGCFQNLYKKMITDTVVTQVRKIYLLLIVVQLFSGTDLNCQISSGKIMNLILCLHLFVFAFLMTFFKNQIYAAHKLLSSVDRHVCNGAYPDNRPLYKELPSIL